MPDLPRQEVEMPEIIRQADEYGLPHPESAPLPPAEHVAEVLKAPSPWAGPLKVSGRHEFDQDSYARGAKSVYELWPDDEGGRHEYPGQGSMDFVEHGAEPELMRDEGFPVMVQWTPESKGPGKHRKGEHLGVDPAPLRPPTPSADPATAMDEPRPAAGAGAGL